MTSLTHANEAGFFGDHGGRFLPPHLEAPIAEVAAAYAEAKDDPTFLAEYEALLADYVGRPSPLFLAQRLTAAGQPPKVLTAGALVGSERATALFEAAYDEHARRLAGYYAGLGV